MIPVLLTNIKTRDGISLEGIAVLPRSKSKTALIWIHGLGSNFARGQTLTQELSKECSRNGIGYFKFNTRGHDIAAKGKKDLIGYGFEKFKECMLDIRAMILYARKLGYRNIFLAGHSTGANKALYYIYKKQDPLVKGLILVAGISDVAAERKIKGIKIVEQGIRVAEILKKKNPHTLMPIKYGLIAARRYLSLYKSGSMEDVFPYHNTQATWKALKNVHISLAVIIGSRDEYLDRTPKEFIDVFRAHTTSTKSFSGFIIKGANHGFRRREKELAREMIVWIKKQK